MQARLYAVALTVDYLAHAYLRNETGERLSAAIKKYYRMMGIKT